MIQSVFLKHFKEKSQAELFQSILQAKGIYVFIASEDNKEGLMDSEGYELHVEINKLDQALSFIEEKEKSQRIDAVQETESLEKKVQGIEELVNPVHKRKSKFLLILVLCLCLILFAVLFYWIS